jgi:antirestriction protein ArdC
MKKKKDVYEIINQRIFDLVEKEGKLPWQKPWKDGFATNLISKKAYRGLNAITLNMLPFTSNYFVTYKQAASLGGKVIKGEKGFPIIFWKFLKIEDKETREEKTIPLLRYFTVFNVEQCEGIPEDKIPKNEKITFNHIEKCEEIINGYMDKPPIEHISNRACYNPIADKIKMPKKELFDCEVSYYSTLFHEIVHSTGHSSRLNRDELKKLAAFGDDSYSKEELTAEMGSAYLCGVAGIDNEHETKQTTAYLQSWLNVLKNNKTWLVSAAGKAQKAIDYIL